MNRNTHTYTLLELSPEAYAEIAVRLAAPRFAPFFQKETKAERIYMFGIAVKPILEVANATGPEAVMRHIVGQVLKLFAVRRAEMFSRSRVERIAFARQVVMFVGRQRGISSLKVGKFLGRDHGTVLGGVKTVEARMATEPKIKILVEKIV